MSKRYYDDKIMFSAIGEVLAADELIKKANAELSTGYSSLLADTKSATSKITVTDCANELNESASFVQDMGGAVEGIEGLMFEGMQIGNMFDTTFDLSALGYDVSAQSLEELLSSIGSATDEELLTYFKENYKFSEEQIESIEDCIKNNNIQTLLSLIVGIQGYNSLDKAYNSNQSKLDELNSKLNGENGVQTQIDALINEREKIGGNTTRWYEIKEELEELEATKEELEQQIRTLSSQQEQISGELYDKSQEINYIALYQKIYEDITNKKTPIPTNNNADFEQFRKNNHDNTALGAFIAYGDYLSEDENRSVDFITLLDTIIATDPNLQNKNDEEKENYLKVALADAASLFSNRGLNLPGQQKFIDNYFFMTDADREVYKVKYQKEGNDNANQFFEDLGIVSLERKKGDAIGYEQLEGLLKTDSDFVQFFDQAINASGRGAVGLFEGIGNFFTGNKNLSANQYATKYIQQTIANINNANTVVTIEGLANLKANGMLDNKKYNELLYNMQNLGTKYTVLDILEEAEYVTKEQADLARKLKANKGASQAALQTAESLGYGIGYMAPAMAASLLTGGGTLGAIAGNALMFFGSAGNKVQEQLRGGATTAEAYGIACAAAAYEVGSGYLLGNIPGLSRVKNILQVAPTDSNSAAIIKILLRNVANFASEGVQEVSEDKVYEALNGAVKGIPTDITNWTSQDKNTFFISGLTQLILNVPGDVVKTATLPFKLHGLEYNVPLSTILMAYNNGGITTEAIERANIEQEFIKINEKFVNASGTMPPVHADLSETTIDKYIGNVKFTTQNAADIYLEMQNDGLDVSIEDVYGLMYRRTLKNSKLGITKALDFLYEHQNSGGGFGADQDIFRGGSKADIERVQQKLMKAGFSASNARAFLDRIDAVGYCSGAAFADDIMLKFRDDPLLFERKLGMPLFNSEGDLNNVEFLVDVFLETNKVENGGYLVNSDTTSSGEKKYYYEPDPSGKDFQVYLSKPDIGLNLQAINAYLKSKSPDLEYLSETIYSSRDSKNLSMRYLQDRIEEIQDIICPRLDNGKVLRMGNDTYGYQNGVEYKNISDGRSNLKLNDMVSPFDLLFTRPNGNKGEGHAVEIVGYNNNGVIVDTHSGLWEVSWKDMATCGVNIYDTGVIYDGGIK